MFANHSNALNNSFHFDAVVRSEDPEGGKWNSERSVPPKDAPRAADGRGESIEGGGEERGTGGWRARSSRVLTLAAVRNATAFLGTNAR